MSISGVSRRWNRAERWAAALGIAAVIVTWNATFDRGIVVAANAYLAAQREHTRGRRPFVQVQNEMRPAVAASAWRATIWSLPVACLGMGAVRFVRSRQKGEK